MVKTRYGTSINLRRAPTSRTLVHVFGNDLKSFSFFQIPNIKINATINYGLSLKRIKNSTFIDFLKIDSLSKFQLIIFIARHFSTASNTAPKRDPICDCVSFRCGFTTAHFIYVCQRLFGDNFFYYFFFLAEIFMMCVNVFYTTLNEISAGSDKRQIFSP